MKETNTALEPIPMKKSSRRLNVMVLVLLIGVTLYVFSREVSLKEMFSTLAGANKAFLCLGLVCAFGFVISQGLGLKVSMKALGTHVSFWRSMLYGFVGAYFCAITPSSTGGQPMVLYYMTRDRYPAGHVSLSLLLYNMAYQCIALVCALVFGLVAGNVIQDVQLVGVLLAIGCMVGVGLLLLMLLVLLRVELLRKMAAGLLRLAKNVHLIKDEQKAKHRVDRLLAQYQQGARLVRQHPSIFLKLCALALLQALCNYLVAYFVCLALGLHHVPFFEILALGAILKVCVTFMPLPGSVGASEGVFAILYKRLLGTLVLPAALISRFLSFYLMLIFEAAAAFWVHANHTKLKQEKKTLCV